MNENHLKIENNFEDMILISTKDTSIEETFILVLVKKKKKNLIMNENHLKIENKFEDMVLISTKDTSIEETFILVLV